VRSRNLFPATIRIEQREPLTGPELVEGSESVMWIRGIAGVVLCALGAVWIGQGSGAMSGSAMSGHASYTVLGGAVAIVGLALLAWAVLIRRRRTSA
jgi:hypothetical protein